MVYYCKKEAPVNGTVVLQQYYLYWGYLQIAAIDLMRVNAPTLWLLHWDPTQPVATRPLSLRKNGTWYTYGHDLTKNVMELYTTAGAIVTEYDYTPYGTVTASGLDQPIQWSSEHYDTELGMVYYNYRHYNPLDGRWISRELLGERGELGLNLYSFLFNRNLFMIDILGLYPSTLNTPEGAAVLAHLARQASSGTATVTAAAAAGAVIEAVDDHESSSGIQEETRTQAETKPRTEPKVTDIPEKYGDCTKQRHSELNKDVGRKCKGPTMKCTEQMCIEDIKMNIERFNACFHARQKINKECFKGGDPGHINEVTNLLRGVGNCYDIWNKKLGRV